MTKPQVESEESEPMSMQDQMIQNLEAINATQAKRLDADHDRIVELETDVELLHARMADRDKHILALERIIRLQDDALDKLGTQLHFLQEGRH